MTSSPSNYSVSLSATLDYKGTPIPISSANIEEWKTDGIVFSLTQPIDVGNLEEFVNWVEEKFGISDINNDATSIQNSIPTSNSILASLQNAFEIFMSAELSITTLNINTNQESYDLGVTMDLQQGSPPVGLELFGGLALDSIGLLISYQGS